LRHPLIVTAAVVCGLAAAPPDASAQVTRVILPTTDGLEPNGLTWVGGMSADGRYLTVTSEATNLVSGDSVRCGIRSCGDVFVLDRDADADGLFDEAGATTIEMVSRRSDGAPADHESYAPSISADGRYVAFTSRAANLLPPGTPLSAQMYRHDRQTHATTIVSVSTAGEPANEGVDQFGVLSADGRVAVFRSPSSNLVAGDTNAACGLPQLCYDVFARDLTTGLTERVSVATTGAEGDHITYFPAVSADGRYVAFSSDASTFVATDTNNVQDVFVRDRVTSTTTRVSVTSDGDEGNAPSFGQNRPAISVDGRLVFFASAASNLPAGAVHDRTTGLTQAACVDPAGTVSQCVSPSLSADARWLAFGGSNGRVYVRDLKLAYTVDLGEGSFPTISANGRHVSFNGYPQSYVVDLDVDVDGLPDPWEARLGLNAASASGADGAAGDADSDGLTNAQEYAGGTHPVALDARFFAEGATSAFFDTRFALFNAGPDTAHTQLTFMRADGTTVSHALAVTPHRRFTVNPTQIPGMDSSEFSVRIDSDRPLVADRTMSWGEGEYGAHAETSVAAPSVRWYLAEGATHHDFDLFYLLQNPAAVASNVRVRYLRPNGPPLEKTYALPPLSRTTVWVDVEQFDGLGAALSATDVSAAIESLDGTPIIVERAMYLSSEGRTFNAGHESAGVTEPREAWFLAEGATGEFFDLFVLIANPNDTAASVRVTYLLGDGQTYSRTLTAPANSRSNIWVDLEQFDGVAGLPLADVAVSTTVEVLNQVPVVVERAMWWPGSSDTWYEAHNSAGAIETGTRWALAEGRVDPNRQEETYILIANTSASAGEARVTVYFEDGTSSVRTYTLNPRSRTNVAVGTDFSILQPRRFSAVVQSLGSTPAQLVVERAMYWTSVFQRWAAGTAALGTRLP
jgi:Tol biopolymer transport system component